MTGWPGQPVIYEINTAVWLNELGRTAGQRVTLAEVADADWDAVTPAGIDKLRQAVIANTNGVLLQRLGPERVGRLTGEPNGGLIQNLYFTTLIVE